MSTNPFDELAARLEQKIDEKIEPVIALIRQFAAGQQQVPVPVKDDGRPMNSSQTAEFLGMAIGTVYQLVNKKQIPHTKRGKLLRFDRKELQAWLDGGRRLTAEQITEEALNAIQR